MRLGTKGPISSPYLNASQYLWAWVTFNGTGTIAIPSSAGSYNVASLTDNGVGDYTVTFERPAPTANYAISGLARYDASTAAGYAAPKVGVAPLAGSLRVTSSDGAGDTATDHARVCIAIWTEGAVPAPQRAWRREVISAWAVFDASVVVSDSHGVASLTDNGAGDWTVTFVSGFQEADSLCVGGITKETAIVGLAIKQSTAIGPTAVTLVTGDPTGARSDPALIYFAAWGN